MVKKEEKSTEIKEYRPEDLTLEIAKGLINCPTATDQEVQAYIQIAKSFKLNPFKREIYFVKYGKDKRGNPNPATILLGYEVYLKRAERTGKYAGMKAWTEGEGDTLKGCVEVYRKDWDKPLYHEVEYQEYVQMKYDPELKKKIPNSFWVSKPKTMIKKVAIAQAFRFAFPDELAGMPYIQEEYHDDEPLEVKNEEDIPEPEEISPQDSPKQPETPTRQVDNPESLKTTQEKRSTPPGLNLEGLPQSKVTAIYKELKEKISKEDLQSLLESLGYKQVKDIRKFEVFKELVMGMHDIVSLEDRFDDTVNEVFDA